MSAVRAIYRAWASKQNGPLTRTGPCFTRIFDRASLDAVTAITLAVDTARGEGEQIVGFASWDRGDGYDPASATMQVHDLIAVTADGYRALWRMLGTFATVVGTIRPFAHPATTLPGSSYRHHRGRYEVASRTCFGSAIRRQHSAQRS